MRPPSAPVEEFRHRGHHHRTQPRPSAGAGARRKGSSSREWLIISDSGRPHVEDLERRSIMQRTGLPLRDMRVLDPLHSYPSKILGRERAIVVNLEHVRAIITAAEVLVPNSGYRSVTDFVQILQSRVSDAIAAPQLEATETSDTSCCPSSSTSNVEERCGIETAKQYGSLASGMSIGSSQSRFNPRRDWSTKQVPFEFRALEVCLESACRCLESETSLLEEEAYPALDNLTSKVSTLNLQSVRQIKSRLVVISGRANKVRDELAQLLDDDIDMAELYLTEKLARQEFGESRSDVDIENDAVEQDDYGDEGFRDGAHSSVHGSSEDLKPRVEELEMLLEVFLFQIEGTVNKLSQLKAYVDDTEDYINIILDEKQILLLQIGVMLYLGTVVENAALVVASLFNMNIRNDRGEDYSPQSNFWEIAFGLILGSLMLYVIAFGFARKGGLL